MNNITLKYNWVTKNIPEDQVKDVADQFFDAAVLLWDRWGVIIPAIINSVLAIELYLKSLTSFEVIKNCDYFGDGVRGGIVTVEPESMQHKLTDIFDRMENWIQDEFIKQYRSSSIYKTGVSFRDCLSTYNDVFIKVRYVYENENSLILRGVNNNELQQLMKLTRDVVESLPKKSTVLK